MRKTHVINVISLFIVLFTTLMACNTSSTETPSLEVTDEGTDTEPFVSFYNKFHQDSLFQISRVSWPLNGNYIQDTAGVAQDLAYTLDEWVMHRPIVDNPDFIQQLQPLTEDLIVEEIKARTGKYRIERRFARLTGGWHLIYYRVTGI